MEEPTKGELKETIKKLHAEMEIIVNAPIPALTKNEAWEYDTRQNQMWDLQSKAEGLQITIDLLTKELMNEKRKPWYKRLKRW